MFDGLSSHVIGKRKTTGDELRDTVSFWRSPFRRLARALADVTMATGALPRDMEHR